MSEAVVDADPQHLCGTALSQSLADSAIQAADQGILQASNVEVMALQFYAPFYMLMTVCDRDPERETESIGILEEHIRQFNRLYGRSI